jgi:hypothetical protein
LSGRPKPNSKFLGVKKVKYSENQVANRTNNMKPALGKWFGVIFYNIKMDIMDEDEYCLINIVTYNGKLAQ